MSRPKGSTNKATYQRERSLAATGELLPRDYLLSVMRDEANEQPVRIDAARAVAPYVHPRLSQVDAKLSGSVDIRSWLHALGEPD